MVWKSVPPKGVRTGILNTGALLQVEVALQSSPPSPPSSSPHPASCDSPAGRWWRGRPKDWSLQPHHKDFDTQQRIMAVVSRRDTRLTLMPYCGEPGVTGHPVYCRHPACRVCLAVERSAQKRRARLRFADCERARLRSPTVLIGATTDLADALSIWRRFKADLSAAIRRQRRRDARWEGVSIMAVMEVAMHRDNEVHLLSTGMQRTLIEIDAPTGQFGSAVWLVHLHGVVHLADVPEAEFREMLTGIACAHRAVHLEPIYQTGTVAEQVTNIMGYAHKPMLTRRDPMRSGGWAPFDDEELAEFVAWCGSADGRFAKRRFHLAATRKWKARMVEAQVQSSANGDDRNAVSAAAHLPITAKKACPRRTARCEWPLADWGLFLSKLPKGSDVRSRRRDGAKSQFVRVPGRASPELPLFRADVPRRVPPSGDSAKRKPLTHWISGESNREASRLGDEGVRVSGPRDPEPASPPARPEDRMTMR